MDVQTNDSGKTTQRRPVTDREAAMENIGRARNEEFEKETGIHIEDTPAVIDPDIDPEAAAAEAERARLAAAAGDDSQLRLQQQQEGDDDKAGREATAAATEKADEATRRAQAAAGIDPKAKYTFKVNGHDTELTGEEVLRRVQKDVSADVRLEQASQTLREAQELQRQVQQAQQRAPAQPAAGVDPDPEAVTEFTRALFKGDSEAATSAFQKAVSSAVAAATADAGRGQSATPVDPTAIAAQVRQQIAIDSALAQSKRDYPDLYADPDIEAVAATKIHRMVQGGTPFVDALDSVQADMATKFGWKKAGSGTPQQLKTDRRQEKLERKEQLDQTPSGTSAKSVTNEEPETTVHDTIREMAKSRGQAAVL